MNINIKSSNLDLTPDINSYIEKRLAFIKKILKSDDGALCEVEVGRTTFHHRKGDVFKAEINLRTKGESLYATAEKEDLYTAIDEVKNEIKNKLLSFKGKKETLFKRGGAKIKGLLKNLRRRQ